MTWVKVSWRVVGLTIDSIEFLRPIQSRSLQSGLALHLFIVQLINALNGQSATRGARTSSVKKPGQGGGAALTRCVSGAHLGEDFAPRAAVAVPGHGADTNAIECAGDQLEHHEVPRAGRVTRRHPVAGGCFHLGFVAAGAGHGLDAQFELTAGAVIHGLDGRGHQQHFGMRAVAGLKPVVHDDGGIAVGIFVRKIREQIHFRLHAFAEQFRGSHVRVISRQGQVHGGFESFQRRLEGRLRRHIERIRRDGLETVMHMPRSFQKERLGQLFVVSECFNFHNI